MFVGKNHPLKDANTKNDIIKNGEKIKHIYTLKYTVALWKKKKHMESTQAILSSIPDEHWWISNPEPCE